MSGVAKNSNKKNIKLYKRVRNNTSWGSVAVFLVLILSFAFLVIYMSGFVLEYILESKFAAGYAEIANTARIYEYGSDDESIMKLIESGDCEFIVTDDAGSVIYQNGENTCSSENGTVKMSNGNERFNVYSDSKADYLYPTKNEVLGFRANKLIKWLDSVSSNPTEADDNGFSPIDGVLVSYTEEVEETHIGIFSFADVGIKYIKLPLWIAIDINGGEQRFIGKAYLTFDMKDNILACELISALLLILFAIVLILLAYIIRSAVNYRRVVKLFYSDPVTNGHNWAWFVRNSEDRVKSSSTKRESFAVINLVFRNYRNYCLCHSIKEGEELLARIDKVLSKEMQKNEMCAHATMSNFAMLLLYNSDEELKKRLDNIIIKLQELGHEHSFEFQVGADLVPPEKKASEKIVRRKGFSIEKAYNNACSARAVLSATEESGIRIFDGGLLDEQRWNDTVHEKQRSALNNEEFEVYYQPKFDPKTDKLRGAEALVRWISPEYGFITPGRFIPIFEKNGFITELDHYMISHVARDQKKWLDEGYECVPVSVNVSRAHFAENDLADQIRDIVDKADCPHDLIEIELTESAFFDDKNAMIDTIKKLKEFGFAVSMDDFGAGYSSLNSLKDMPLDVLKLDADFFRGENSGDRGEIVVAEAIKLAKNLDMRTVAEGVEEKEQVDFLAEQGCDMIQGYYYAKPMPKNEYAEKMTHSIETTE